MNELQKLQVEIELARNRLDLAVAQSGDMLQCYALNLEMDRLIEKYLDLYDALKKADTVPA